MYKVKGCRVRSWILETSAGSFSLSGCPNFRCSQKRCRCLTWGTNGCKNPPIRSPSKLIDYGENIFHFIGFQTLTLETLLTCATWGFSSWKCAQLIIKGIGKGNNHCWVTASAVWIYPIVAWNCVGNTEHMIQGWWLDTCISRCWPNMLILRIPILVALTSPFPSVTQLGV